MQLTEIPGTDLALRLDRPVMAAVPDLDRMLRVGEATAFDALQLAREVNGEPDLMVRQLARTHEFSLVRLPVNIRPTPDATVRFLAVEVTFDASEATCWSLDPERVDDERKVTTTFSVNGALKPSLADVEVGRQRESEYVVRTPRITAFGLGTPEIAWEFSPARESRLSGPQLLHFVMKSPKGCQTRGSVTMKADIVERGRLWNTRAVRFDGASEVATVILPPAVERGDTTGRLDGRNRTGRKRV